MPPGDDDEVTVKGLFEDAISPELEETARAARDAARALAETGAGGEAAAVGMDRATIAGGRLERQLKDVDRAAEQQRLAQLRLTAAEQEAQKIRQKGVLTAAETARVEGMLSHAHADASRTAKDLTVSHTLLREATDSLGVRFLRTASSVGFLSKAFTGLKMVATADVFTSLIGGVSSLGAAGVAAVAGLVPLLGAAGAIPALGLAAVSAFGAVSLLTGGITSAVKAMQSAGPASASAQSALNHLGPSSADLAMRVYDLSFSLRDMREQAVRTSMPELTHTLSNVRSLLPTVRLGFVGVTQAMSQTVDEATTRMVGARSDLDLIAQRNTILVRTIGHAVVDGLDAGRHIMVGAGPMVQGFADRFSGEMHRIDSELASNPARVQAFFDRTFTRVMTFVHVLADFGHGVLAIFQGAQPLTDHMGGRIVAMADRFDQWTASVGGRNAIRDFFERSIPVIDQVDHILGNIFHSLGTLSTQGGTAGTLHAIADIIPPLTTLLTLVEKVANTVPGANTVLGMLFLLNRFGMGPGTMGRGTSGLIRGGLLFRRGMQGVEGVEGGFLGRTSQSMMGRLGARLGGRGAAGLAAMGGEDAGALAVGGLGAEAGGAGLMGLLAAVPIVGWIAAAVIAIGTGAVLLYQHWKPFRDLVDDTGKLIATAAEWVAHQFMSAVHGVAHGAEAIWHAFETAYHWVEKIVDKAAHIGGTVLHDITHPWELVGLYAGGPVTAGRPYLVGERGPELFATAGGMRVVGGDGAELIASRTPGFVLPNEALRAIDRIDVRSAASRAFPTAAPIEGSLLPVGGSDRGAQFAVALQGLPPITVGPVHVHSEVDLERAVKAGIEAWQREMADRS